MRANKFIIGILVAALCAIGPMETFGKSARGGGGYSKPSSRSSSGYSKPVSSDGYSAPKSTLPSSSSGGYAKPSTGGGYSKPASSESSPWSGSTKDTWDRSGGGNLGGASSGGYSKPSMKAGDGAATPSGGLFGGSRAAPGSGGYKKPSVVDSKEGTGAGQVGATPREDRGSGGYNKPSVAEPRDGAGAVSGRAHRDDGPSAPTSGWGGRTSGGYSKPTTSTAPSGEPRAVSPSSGGYAKPVTPKADQKPVGGGFDQQAINQERKRRSGESLNKYKEEQKRFQQPESGPRGQDLANNPLYDRSKVYTNFDYGSHYRNRDNYYGGMNWRAPGYAYGGAPSFGVFDALFLYWMLDHISDKNVAATAYHHQNDPGFQKWREEVEKQSKDNAELKAKLAQMDKQIKGMEGTPKDPAYLPPGVPTEVAVAASALAAKKPDAPVLRIATGKPGGWYDKYGEMLKKLGENFNVELVPTNGSTENLKLLAEGKVDMALAQSDVLAFMDPSAKTMTEQATLYPEYMQLIANRSGGVKSAEDINPKKHVVYIGPKNSGTALTWQGLAELSPWYKKIPVKYAEYPDAFAEVVRNPNALMLFVGGLNSDFLKKAELETSKTGKLRLVEIVDKRFLGKKDSHGNAIYKAVEIPSSIYPDLQRGWFFAGAVDTLAVQAVVVLRSEWTQKYGAEAMNSLSELIAKTRPQIRKLVNAD